MATPTEIALARFDEGFACSQSVFSAYAPLFDVDPELALRIAAPFGAGMGLMGEVCGAVSGAFMVLGLKAGNTLAQDQSSKQRSYDLAREFAERFRARHGSILCRELLGCAIDTPEGLQAARASGVFEELCPRLVQDSAEIVAELLENV
jgi:C_GCAxxG_C_C family probable redox protein